MWMNTEAVTTTAAQERFIFRKAAMAMSFPAYPGAAQTKDILNMITRRLDMIRYKISLPISHKMQFDVPCKVKKKQILRE